MHGLSNASLSGRTCNDVRTGQRKPRREFATGAIKLHALKHITDKGKRPTYLVYHDDGDPFEIRASGRFVLRSLGVEINTVMEPHEGPFPGKHGRYVLQSLVLKGGAA